MKRRRQLVVDHVNIFHETTSRAHYRAPTEEDYSYQSDPSPKKEDQKYRGFLAARLTAAMRTSAQRDYSVSRHLWEEQFVEAADSDSLVLQETHKDIRLLENTILLRELTVAASADQFHGERTSHDALGVKLAVETQYRDDQPRGRGTIIPVASPAAKEPEVRDISEYVKRDIFNFKPLPENFLSHSMREHGLDSLAEPRTVPKVEERVRRGVQSQYTTEFVPRSTEEPDQVYTRLDFHKTKSEVVFIDKK